MIWKKKHSRGRWRKNFYIEFLFLYSSSNSHWMILFSSLTCHQGKLPSVTCQSFYHTWQSGTCHMAFDREETWSFHFLPLPKIGKITLWKPKIGNQIICENVWLMWWIRLKLEWKPNLEICFISMQN